MNRINNHKAQLELLEGSAIIIDVREPSEFKEHQVWNPNHVDHFKFLKELNRTLPAKNAWSNLQEFITPTKYNI